MKKFFNVIFILILTLVFSSCGKERRLPTPPSGDGDNGGGDAEARESVFFQGNNGTLAGAQLFVTDGTEKGTKLVKVINENGESYARGFVKIGNITYFTADDGIHGVELWRTDGTESGTYMVKDIYEGLEGSPIGSIKVFKGKFYFSAYEPVHGVELWESDGTAQGTRLVTDIMPGSDSSYPQDFVIIDEKLYFNANGPGGDGFNYNRLFSYDGTKLSLISAFLDATSPVLFNGEIYFNAMDGVYGAYLGNELYKYDTEKGEPVLAIDIREGVDSTDPSEFTVVGEHLYFRAFRAYGEGITYGLYRMDATGEVELYNLNPEGLSDVYSLIAFKDKLFFMAKEGSDLCHQIFYINEMNVPTKIKETLPLSGSCTELNILEVLGDNLYFTATAEKLNGKELWVTDGTTEGTHIVKQGLEPHDGLGTNIFTMINGDILFDANDAFMVSSGGHGKEIWVSKDGTPDNTYMLTDLNKSIDAWGQAGNGVGPKADEPKPKK